MGERSYSRQTREAVILLSILIRFTRKSRRLTATEVAERAGISRHTLRRIENGDLKSELGLFFEVATVVGVPLISPEQRTLRNEIAHGGEKLSLLPKNIHRPRRRVKDDF